MTRVPENARGLVAFTSFFQSWAREGLSTADIWGSLRFLESQGQIDLTGVQGSDVSVMRGYAGALNRNEDTLASLSTDQSLGNLRIPEAPWSRSPVEQSMNPQWQIRILQTFLDNEGNLQTAYRTIVARGDLPGTVGDLLDFATTEGEALMDAGRPGSQGIAQLGVSLVGVMAV